MPGAHRRDRRARVAEADQSAAARGRLSARPGAGPAGSVLAGVHQLDLEGGRHALLRIPAGGASRAAPLVLLLHGAGASGADILPVLADQADAAGLILLAPDSRVETWDLIRGGFGPDVAFIDRALALTFETCAVDPARVVAAGFSDGASYALSLGLGNGDLFTHVLAFSPGFAAPAERHGEPRVFVSHGTRDQVLPVDACSRRLVPRLRRAGYEVRYDEFDGGHVVPEATVGEAVRWLLDAGREGG